MNSSYLLLEEERRNLALSRKQILTRIIFSTVAFILLAIIFSSMIVTFDTMLNNYLAIGQLENDDGSWILFQMYQNIGRPTMNILSIAISFSYLLYLSLNIFRFFKIKTKEIKTNEKDY